MSVAETRPAAKGRLSTPIALMPAVLQHEWDLYHATWFTLMGVGGGIFLLSRLMRLERGLGVWLGLPVVDLVSFIVISVGGVILLWSLGRPLRFLRPVEQHRRGSAAGRPRRAPPGRASR